MRDPGGGARAPGAVPEDRRNNDDPFYPGTRAAGTQGYADSVDYVAGLLKDAGYQVTLDSFEFQFQFPALLQQLTPVNAVYETGAFTDSGSGDVTGNVIAVDINLTGDRASTSGCEAADFTALDFSGPSDIALIQRGTCTFADKALNAQAAGAEAVIIFNQGNTPDREGLIVGTLAPAEPTIPVVGASFAAGEQFDPCYHLACDTFDNVNLHALEVNSDLIAFAQLTFAYSTESVNGVPGKQVPGPPVNLPPPAGPEGTFGSTDGGGGPGPIES